MKISSSKTHETLGRVTPDQEAGSRAFKSKIKDVAVEAGVSVATVSRVVNGSSAYIAPATRARVEKAIELLHYAPNSLIRSLQSGRTNIVVFTSLHNLLLNRDEFELAILTELCRAMQPRGYDVLIPAGSLNANGVIRVSSLLDGRCDGVILECPTKTPVLDALAHQGFPTVVLWNRNVPAGVGSVRVDNSYGTREALDYLIGLGHRRIAHLAGPMQYWDEAQWRKDEYVNVLEGAGIQADTLLVQPSGGSETWDADVNEVLAALKIWMGLPQPPTAVFCASDRLASALVLAAAQLGVRVPKDLSVIGYDDLPLAARTIPPLTSVKVPLDRVATAAASMLSAIIEERLSSRRGPGSGKHASARTEIVRPELTVRGSTAAPRGR
jgi:LacI family transcriptional regulator